MNSQLFHPITFRGIEIRNRLWVSPMCQYSAEREDGMANDWHLVHQGSFARGGAGLVMTEATAVVPEGRISAQDLGLWSDEHIEPLRRITDFHHGQGARAGIQLAHAGRKASTNLPWTTGRRSLSEDERGWQTYGPTDAPYGELNAPLASSQEYIAHIVEEFGQAAERAVQAGYDLIEIHAAHGYYLHSFLSPRTNTRTDEYGGDQAGRSRILVEVLQRVRRAAEHLPISVRFSASDYLDDGLDVHEVAEIATIAKQYGADLVDVSSGGLDPEQQLTEYPGYQVEFARIIRERSGLPTAAVGLITNPQHAEAVLSAGYADVILMGREFLRDPHFGLRAAAELGEDTRFVPPQYVRAPFPVPGLPQER